jgi:hypothetical protein
MARLTEIHRQQWDRIGEAMSIDVQMVHRPVRLAGGWWLVLIYSEIKVLLASCWWLVCSERKVLLAGG